MDLVFVGGWVGDGVECIVLLVCIIVNVLVLFCIGEVVGVVYVELVFWF